MNSTYKKSFVLLALAFGSINVCYALNVAGLVKELTRDVSVVSQSGFVCRYMTRYSNQPYSNPGICQATVTCPAGKIPSPVISDCKSNNYGKNNMDPYVSQDPVTNQTSLTCKVNRPVCNINVNPYGQTSYYGVCNDITYDVVARCITTPDDATLNKLGITVNKVPRSDLIPIE